MVAVHIAELEVRPLKIRGPNTKGLNRQNSALAFTSMDPWLQIKPKVSDNVEKCQKQLPRDSALDKSIIRRIFAVKTL